MVQQVQVASGWVKSVSATGWRTGPKQNSPGVVELHSLNIASTSLNRANVQCNRLNGPRGGDGDRSFGGSDDDAAGSLVKAKGAALSPSP